MLEHQGYRPLGYFVLPEACWLDAYGRPMQRRFADCLAAHGTSEAAQAVVAAEQREADLYERHRSFVSHGHYSAQRAEDWPARRA